MANSYFKIDAEKKEIEVSHDGGRITFSRFPLGHKTYCELHDEIRGSNLIFPSMSQMVSLFHTAMQNKEVPELKEVLDKLDNEKKHDCFWTSNGILYVPNEGAYIQDNPSVVSRGSWSEVSINRAGLIRELEAGNPSVRFVPFGYKTREQTFSDLERNSFLIGLMGEEGVCKFAEMARNYKELPFLWTSNEVTEEKVDTASICCGFQNQGLSIGFTIYGASVFPMKNAQN